MLNHPFAISPLGDSALLVEFGNEISPGVHARVMSLYQSLRNDTIPGVLDLVPAYASLAVYYDLLQSATSAVSAFDHMASWVEKHSGTSEKINLSVKKYRVPVCYEMPYAVDIQAMAGESGMDVETIIRIHTGREYQVYMTGFLPGFAYMGELDERIAFGRKATPAREVKAGSVGIAGRQTGIYPLDSPGGWQIIGRTPLRIFDAARPDPVLFMPGDRVRFYPVSANEYQNYQAGNI